MRSIVQILELIILIAWVTCLGGVIISLVQAHFLQALGCFIALWIVSKIKITYHPLREKDSGTEPGDRQS